VCLAKILTYAQLIIEPCLEHASKRAASMLLLPQYKDDDVRYTRGSSRHHKSWLACDTCPPVISAELINPGYISQSAYHCLCLSLLVLIVWLANHSACLILIKKLFFSAGFLEANHSPPPKKIALLFICVLLFYITVHAQTCHALICQGIGYIL